MKNKKINILYLTYTMPKPFSPVRGVFTYYRLQELYKSKDINLHVITFEHIFNILKFKKNYFLNEIGYETDINVRSLLKFEYPQMYIDLLRNITLNYLRNYIKTNSVDLIHAHFIRDGYYTYLLKKKIGVPYIVTAHGSDIHTLPYKSKINKRKTLKVLNNADKVIFVTNSLKNESIKLEYNKNNYEIIPNGINTSVFTFQNRDNIKELNLGFVGNLIDIKNVMILPKVFKYLKKKNIDFNFHLIGDGNLKNELLNEINELSIDYHYYGTLPHFNVAEVMQNIDILLFPSNKEGFGLVALEAIATGAMVVSSGIEAIKEVIGPCGKAVEFGENFEERFADAIIELWNNPIEPEILKKHSEKFHWENTVAQEIEVYKEVLGRE